MAASDGVVEVGTHSVSTSEPHTSITHTTTHRSRGIFTLSLGACRPLVILRCPRWLFHTVFTQKTSNYASLPTYMHDILVSRLGTKVKTQVYLPTMDWPRRESFRGDSGGGGLLSSFCSLPLGLETVWPQLNSASPHAARGDKTHYAWLVRLRDLCSSPYEFCGPPCPPPVTDSAIAAARGNTSYQAKG